MNPTKDPVYDKDDQRPVTRPDLRQLEEGNSASSKSGQSHTSSGNSFKFNPDGDNDKHGSGNTGTDGDSFNFNQHGDGAVGAAGLATRELALGGGAVGAATTALGGAKNLFFGSKRRKQTTLGGGIIALIVGSIMLALGISSGPAELVHLSHIMQRSFSNSQNASSNRLDKLFRYATASDVGETRIGSLERRVIRPQITALNDLGISFDLNKIAGIDGTTIDTDKLAEKYPELKSVPEAERGTWLADNVFSNVAQAGGEFQHKGGGVYEIDGSNSNVSSLSFDKTVASDSLGALDDNGHIVSALNRRIMGKYLGIPSLFHPLSRAASEQLKKTLATSKNQTEDEKKSVQTEEGKIQSPVEDTAEAKESVSDVEDAKGSLTGSAVNSLALFGGACFAKHVGGEINTINRARIVLPAVVEAFNFVALGAQIESGQDVGMAQVEAVGKSLTDSQSQGIWSAQSLQALAGDSSHGGTDISPDYRQAFLGSSIGNTVTKVADDSLAAWPVPGVDPCGKVGTIIQIGGTIGLSLGAVVSEIATAGLDTPGIAAAAGWWTVEQASQFGEAALAMHFLESFVLSSTTSAKLAEDAFSGPTGGNLLAYGARYGAGIAGAAEGLVPLDNTNSAAVTDQEEQQSQQQFASESLFARLFDINDYRSLTGHLADLIGPGMTTSFANGASNFGNIGHSLMWSLSSLFLPKSLAAPPSYNWGFSLFGLPSNLANTTDPSLANPYTNADDVAATLNACSDNGANPSNCDLVKKASTCFGVEISQTQDDSGKNVWDVTPKQPIDITTSDFQSQDCGNDSDPGWQRMILFVLDTQTAKAAACWTGDDQSCQGIGYGSDTSSSGSVDGGSPASSGDFGTGSGKFTTDTSHPAYPGLDKMLARVKAVNNDPSVASAFCASLQSGTCGGYCMAAVGMAWIDEASGYGSPFGSAGNTPTSDSAWAAALNSGHAHPGDRNPPVGALLIYNKHDPADKWGHVTIYLGNNMVFSTDFDHQNSAGIQPASHIEVGDWANSYVGWMDPYFYGKVGD